MMQPVPAELAIASVRSNSARKFPDCEDDRHRDGLVFPALNPSFEISQGQRVFTIGSCFARNIEEELASRDIDVPTLNFSSPQEELKEASRANKALNQYNLGTMLQCIKAIEQGVADSGFYARMGGMVLDPILATGGVPVSQDRARERRGQIRDLYARELPHCDVAIITLGLTEAWYDNDAQLFLNVAPTRRMIDKEPGRFAFYNLQYEDVRDMLREMVTSIQSYGCRNVLLTVSPVPLKSTYSDKDCVVANLTSKMILRLAAVSIADALEYVDYFPSYEVITSGGSSAFHPDLRHPKGRIVADVVSYMLDAYMPSAKNQRPHRHQWLQRGKS